MKKLFIIHENDEWVEPLLVQLLNLQVPFEDWHMDKVSINTLNDPPKWLDTASLKMKI